MGSSNTILVAAVAAVAGAGAAFGAVVALQPAPVRQDSGDVAERLDRIETAVARIATAQADSSRDMAKLSERITGLQMDLSSAREEMRSGPGLGDSDETVESGRPGRARRPDAVVGLGEESATREGKLPGRRRVWLGGKPGEGATLSTDGTIEMDGITTRLGEIDGALKGLSKGIQLRMLPEDQRWKKAQEDLVLQDYQVENLKRAVKERDEAMKGAMEVESGDQEDGSFLKIRRMDAEKAATAQREYDRKVTETLDSSQKKKWDDNGYGHAFGGQGGTMSVSIVRTVQTSDDSSSSQDGK